MAGTGCGSTSTFSSYGLSERARRLREMIAERQAHPSRYSSSPAHRAHIPRLLAKTPTLIEESLKYGNSQNGEQLSNGCTMRQHHTVVLKGIQAPKKSSTDPQVNSYVNGEAALEMNSFESSGKEKKKSARRYLGSLTSTKYLQQIFAPIMSDNQMASTKEFRGCVTAKQSGNTGTAEGDSDVCAIVVPSGSTTQVPVIKRSGRGKIPAIIVDGLRNSYEADTCITGIGIEMCQTDGQDVGCSVIEQSSPRERNILEQYGQIPRKPERFSLIHENINSRSPDLQCVAESDCRRKSVNLESSFSNDLGGTISIADPSHILELDGIRKVKKVSLLHCSPPTLNQRRSSCLDEFPETSVSVVRDEEAANLSAHASASTRRPLVTITNGRGLVSRNTDLVDHCVTVARHRSLSPLERSNFDHHHLLPSLIEAKPHSDDKEKSVLFEDVTNSTSIRKGSARSYVRSHTTSTYNGRFDAAPDASPRRHLIGFLHRTSHLSLTSELSADASFYLIGHRAARRFEDSTIGSESDARLFSDDDDRSRVSTSTDITSVSRQHQANAYRKRRNRRKFRQPSRASSFSSITESSMSLDVITVTLNMDTVNFLGISIVGQSSSRGDNGIYVANIMKGGAVALDGRIEPGDMILQVNDISFENFTNDQAVDVLRESVARRGPIKLTVAKMWDGGPRSAFTVPRHRDEPVRPIDTQAWIQHTNAMRGMPSILEGSEGAPTPVPGQYGRPPSSSTMTSNGSAPNTVVGGTHVRLDTNTDKKKIVQMMVMPNSGLDIKNRTWLKIPIPMSFLGSDLVDWLMEHVDGLRDRKDGRKFAGELLKEKLISHVVNKITFTEQCYYILGDECAEFARLRQNPPSGEEPGVHSEVGSILPPPPPGLMAAAAVQQQQTNRGWPQTGILQNAPPSMVSGYASMPLSPYPGQQQPQQFAPSLVHGMANPAMVYKGGGGPDVHSQTSSNDGSSGSEHIRVGRPMLPPAPVPSLSTLSQHIQVGGSASLAAGPSVGAHAATNRLDELPQDLASSRQSFRIAMSQPFEFFVDNL